MILSGRVLISNATRRCLAPSTVVQVNREQARNINLDKLSNKRITRIESDIELESNDFSSRLINRNPRNLEQMSFEKKPTGYWLDQSPPSTWNRIVFEQNGRYLNAYLKHWSGRKLVEASTREEILSKYYNSPNTTQAAIVLAQVLARRCLQSGYLYAGYDEDEINEKTGLKIKTFYETVESNGVALVEPPEIVPRVVTDL